MTAATPAGASAAPPTPADLVRSRAYLSLLVLGAIVGVPVAVFAFWFLKAVSETQQWVFTTLPKDVGLNPVPMWWPIPILTLSGVIVAGAIHYLPGTGGHEPAEGFKTGTLPQMDMPGIFVASFATLALGVVLGPEAPLIALGAGLAVLIVYLFKRDAPAQAIVVLGAAGSFAAISTMLGNPLAGAFLLMEAAGIGGSMISVVFMPGLVAAGIGALIFVGLDTLTGFGTFSLAVPNIPSFTTPTVAEFLWAIGIGVAAAVVGTAIRRGALALQPVVARRRLALTPVVGLAIGLATLLFTETTGKSSSQVLFSGQNALAPLVNNAAQWTVGALVMLILCKSFAYSLSLSSFRGGPTFPAMFIGAAGGIALSHAAGLPMIAGVGMGIGAMTVVMLSLPLTSVLLAILFLQSDAAALLPLVIVAVAVAFVASARLMPAEPRVSPESAAPSAHPASVPGSA
jgi:H+/Cl- antiporter ClcA